MNRDLIHPLAYALWEDLDRPEVLWQVAALVLCLAAAWAISRAIRLPKLERSSVWRFGVGGLNRILFPLVGLTLVLAVRPVLARWEHVNLLHLAVPLLGSLALIRVLVYALNHVFGRSGAIAAFERLIALLVWSVVALHILGLLPAVTDFLEDIRLAIGKEHVSLLLILQAMFWALLTVLAALWAGSAVEARLMRADSLHSSLRVAFARVTKSLLLVVAVLMVLPLVGIDLTVLSVFGGALGVGLGLGLQKIASNYVSGFIILIDRSIRLGDVVTADSFFGVVKDITTRYTVVRAFDGREAIIPNDTLINTTVLNHTLSDSKLRLATTVQVGYGTDVDRAMEILREVAARNPRVLKDPAPGALLTRFADSGIELELGFWIQDPVSGTLGLRAELNLEVWRAFRRERIEIPYPQQVLHFASPDPSATP